MRPNSTSSRPVRVWLLAFAAVWPSGCNRPPEPYSVAEEDLSQMVDLDIESNSDEMRFRVDEAEQPSGTIKFPTDDQVWIRADQLPWEANYVQYIGGKQIGYSVVTVERSVLTGSSRLHIRRQEQFQVQQDGRRATIESKLDAFENANGRPANFTLTTTRGEVSHVVEGQLLQNLVLTNDADGQRTRQSLSWTDGGWGVLGVQAVLMRKPMQPGELRQCVILIPGLNDLAQVEMAARDLEPTPLASGEIETLLCVDVLMHTASSSIHSRNWVNETGEIEKTQTLSEPSIITFRIPREARMRLESAMRFARLKDVTTSVVSNLPRWAPNERATYRVKTARDDPFKFILQTPTQQVRSLSPHVAEVQIRLPGTSVEADADEQPNASHLGQSFYVQPKHQIIDDMAAAICGSEADAETISDLLVRTLSSKIETTQPAVQLTSSLDTARRLKGDAKAQAVLLTALLRNREIPSRIVVGVHVQETSTEQLGLHLWAEAWIDGSWLGLDPTLGTRCGPGHIGMQATSLEADDPYTEMLSVLDAIQKIEHIEVVAFE